MTHRWIRRRRRAPGADIASRRPLAELRARLRHWRDPYECRRAVELVTDYVEGAMSPADRRRFERHLRTCPACVRYVEQVRHTCDVLGQIHVRPPAGPTRDALLAAYREFRRG